MRSETSRELTDEERRVLERLLSVEFDGVQALRSQAARVRAAGRCPCGCPSIELTVPPDVPIAAWSSGRAPCLGELTQIGDELPAQITLLVTDGRMSYLELIWYGAQHPLGWPPTERIVVSKHQ